MTFTEFTRTARPRPPGRPDIDVAIALVARETGIACAAILDEGRCETAIADARHLAIYLAHVILGHGMARLAAVFGRDRASLRHALRRVEDRRDDPRFDRWLSGLEAVLLPLRHCGIGRGA